MLEITKDVITEVLSLKNSERDKITMDTSLKENLGADSLDIVDITLELEDRIEVEIPDEVYKEFKTVGDIVNYLNSL